MTAAESRKTNKPKFLSHFLPPKKRASAWPGFIHHLRHHSAPQRRHPGRERSRQGNHIFDPVAGTGRGVAITKDDAAKDPVSDPSIHCRQWLDILDELDIGAFAVNLRHQITAMNCCAQALIGLGESEVLARDCPDRSATTIPFPI
jgi:hypothetical protein